MAAPVPVHPSQLDGTAVKHVDLVRFPRNAPFDISLLFPRPGRANACEIGPPARSPGGSGKHAQTGQIWSRQVCRKFGSCKGTVTSTWFTLPSLFTLALGREEG